MNERLLRLDKVEIAGICGRFARLKEQSKKPIGLSTLAEMASVRSSKKTARIVRAEIIKEIESHAICPSGFSKTVLLEGDIAIYHKSDWWQSLKSGLKEGKNENRSGTEDE